MDSTGSGETLQQLRDQLQRLKAENAKLRDDLEAMRARLGYAPGEIVDLRKKVPTTQPQAAMPGTSNPDRRERSSAPEAP